MSVYIVLRAPFEDEDSLKAQISRLSIGIEAHAISTNQVNTSSRQPGQPPTGSLPRDVLWSAKLDVNEEPLMAMEESDESDHNQDVLLLWKLTATLST